MVINDKIVPRLVSPASFDDSYGLLYSAESFLHQGLEVYPLGWGGAINRLVNAYQAPQGCNEVLRENTMFGER